jgi:DNA-3-methyladenine glycosylase I
MILYHDTEWGVPVHDDRTLFEFLILEGAQAGLSWETILRKRAGYRAAFANFEPARVARFDKRRIASLMRNPAIVRNRLKIAAAIANARAVLAVQAEFGSLDAYLWAYTGGASLRAVRRKPEDVPATTDLADQISRDLRVRGMRFVGPTIIYAFMQATGMVNDHLVTCFRYRELAIGQNSRETAKRR